MRRNRIVRVGTKLLLPLIFLFALYVQFHGDFGPGGGFQAGVILAAGVILYALVFDLDNAMRVVSVRALEILAPLGVLIYAGVGVASLLRGGNFLDYNVLARDAVHGQELGIVLVELGVVVTVAAVMIAIFFAFAGRGD